MLIKLLEALEKNVNIHDCAINDILYDYDEEICHTCERDCDECKQASHETLKKLKEEASKKKMKLIELLNVTDGTVVCYFDDECIEIEVCPNTTNEVLNDFSDGFLNTEVEKICTEEDLSRICVFLKEKRND